MGLMTSTCVLIGIIFSILLYFYLRVVYECIRRVNVIRKIDHQTSKKQSSSNTTVSQSNADLDQSAAATLPSGEFVKRLSVCKRQAPGPLPWPLIGNLAMLSQYAVPFIGFTALAKRYGNIYTLTLGSTRCLVVNNLELIREVLNQNGKFFGGRPNFYRFHKLFGGNRNNSLALCDWSQLQQKRRNLARKHCSPRDSSSYFQKMSDVGCFEIYEFMDRLKKCIAPGKEIQLKPLIQQTCANMFIQYMCSVRFNYDDGGFQEIVRYFDEIFWEINQGYAVDFLPMLLPFYASHMKKIVFWSSSIRKFILQRIVFERERNLDVDEPEKDFTDALLKALAQDGDVDRETIIFMLEDFIGGHSAVGNLVFLCLANIIRNPEVGVKIQEEVDVITDYGKRKVRLTDMERMPYTVATIYEVLRYSSSPIVPHVATEDVEIAGFGVTKGTIVFINNYELNTSERYWDEPTKFNPDRFLEPLPPNSNTQTDATCMKKFQLRKNIPHFLPFSIGKRTCIGQNLVKGFGFIMLSNIMQQYDVTCRDTSTIKTYPACVAVPPDTFPMILTPRRT